MFKGLFKKRKTRAEPDKVQAWIRGVTGEEVIVPEGYVSLENNEEIKRCIHKIADLVSDMTIMLLQNGENGDIRIKNELSKKIDVYPNAFMVRKNFIYTIVTDMLSKGNAIVIPETENGYISNLRIISPDEVSYSKNENGYNLWYKGKYLNPNEVLHFVYIPSKDCRYWGEGITPLLKSTIENLSQANATKKAFLKSKWKPTLIISMQADAEELQDKEMRREILGSYTETTELGEPWLIPAGEIKVEKITPLTLNDLAIQDSITLDIKTIASIFNIPPFMVGIGEFNKDEYNNFINTTIMSTATIIQQEYTKKLLYSPDLYFKFNPKSLLQYDLSEKASFVKEMISGGILNRNEGRCEFDYSPVDVEGMNNYTVLENYLEVADLDKQKKLRKDDEE